MSSALSDWPQSSSSEWPQDEGIGRLLLAKRAVMPHSRATRRFIIEFSAGPQLYRDHDKQLYNWHKFSVPWAHLFWCFVGFLFARKLTAGRLKPGKEGVLEKVKHLQTNQKIQQDNMMHFFQILLDCLK